MRFDPDPVIRRIERGALVWCALAAAATLAVRPDAPSIAGGVVGGGLLTFISLFAIRGSIDAMLARPAAASTPPAPAPAPPPSAGDPGEPPDPPDQPDPPAPARAGAITGVKLAGRYGLLALAAYVMIVRFRLHAVGVLIGASSLVAATSMEAVRGLRRP